MSISWFKINEEIAVFGSYYGNYCIALTSTFRIQPIDICSLNTIYGSNLRNISRLAAFVLVKISNVFFYKQTNHH